MARQYGEGIEVREVGGSDAGGFGTAPRAPEAFLRRGRLYVVRAVLGHWWEPRAWWTALPARMVRGEDFDGGDVDGASPALRGAGALHAQRPGTEQVEQVRETEWALGEENEVWRVEASPGWAAGSGVYDLCRAPSPASGSTQTWCLLRVTD